MLQTSVQVYIPRKNRAGMRELSVITSVQEMRQV
jgi:hypothetical protein